MNRVLISLMGALFLMTPLTSEAFDLNGFYAAWPDFSVYADCELQEVTTDFPARIAEQRDIPSSAYTYYLNGSWTDSPSGLPTDYISDFPGSRFDIVFTHSSRESMALTYWANASARDTYWTEFTADSSDYANEF